MHLYEGNKNSFSGSILKDVQYKRPNSTLVISIHYLLITFVNFFIVNKNKTRLGTVTKK